MGWSVRHHPEFQGAGGYVETVFGGMMSGGELQAAVAECLRVAGANDINRLLADCSTLEGGHSVFDLYQVAERVAGAGLRPPLHEAVLIPDHADMVASVEFWQTAATNRGMVVRVFKDRKSALDWLVGSPAHSGSAERQDTSASDTVLARDNNIGA